MPSGIENKVAHLFGLIIGNATTPNKIQIRNDGSIKPASLADGDAANDSVYYSTTQSKLVYKDSGGSVNDLY
jgi:hypothetical protein